MRGVVVHDVSQATRDALAAADLHGLAYEERGADELLVRAVRGHITDAGIAWVVATLRLAGIQAPVEVVPLDVEG